LSTSNAELTSEETTSEVTTWVERTWNPDMTLAQWWQELANAGFAVPHWPTQWFGRGWSRSQALLVHRTLRTLNVPGPPAGLGIMLAGPTILEHGTNAQKQRFLPDIVNGLSNWCQLFSEPGAGSDLASLQTRAVKDGSQWTVHGQKVWTSNGQLADHGMLLARTNLEAPAHHNISWFAIEMDQPTIDVRPLREMTGRSLFTEVFLDGALASDDNIIGELHEGWPVARTTLMNERVGLGGGGGAVGAIPGRLGGMLTSRAGDSSKKKSVGPSSGTSLAMRGRSYDELAAVAKSEAPLSPLVRDQLVTLYSLERLAQLSQQRGQAEGPKSALGRSGGSIGKLLSTRCTQLAREVGMSMIGSKGMLWAGDRSPAGVIQEQCLFSPAVSIYGGTDQVQKNILAERVLGLPRN
jgi:alkylation response protein AidB-like acyl-CoA dehydrogenase